MVSRRNQVKHCEVCGQEMAVMSSRRRYCNHCRQSRLADGRCVAAPRSPDPSPIEIATMTAEIRRSWSEQTRVGRFVGPHTVGWETPRVSVCIPVD